MFLSQIVNDYGKMYSPYIRGQVNDLPMTQIALYKMSGDIEKVKNHTDLFLENVSFEPLKSDFPKVESIEECLGRKELYGSCLKLMESKIESEGVDQVLHYVLNTYTLGLSSDLFHTIIRVAYAMEGYKTEEELKDELARSLAYYLTSYSEGKSFTREISGLDTFSEMTRIVENPYIDGIRRSNIPFSQKLNSFYSDREFTQRGFVIGGNEEDKVRFLLNFVLPAFTNSNDNVILHSITAIHAVVALKGYFDDFNKALDILTSSIITHLMTVEKLDFTNRDRTLVDFSWRNIICMGMESPDLHTIKFTYSCSELGKQYEMVGLKKAVKKRIFQ
ncbi:MAG: hypothetical protein WC983_05840 [Tissierellaceae bacterium]